MTIAYLPPAAAPAPQVEMAGNRDEFPRTCAPAPEGGIRCTSERGSGRLPLAATQWYRVVVGGYEAITFPDGTEQQQYVTARFNLEVPDAFLGLGHRDAIEAAALEEFPHLTLVDFWTRSAPATEF